MPAGSKGTADHHTRAAPSHLEGLHHLGQGQRGLCRGERHRRIDALSEGSDDRDAPLSDGCGDGVCADASDDPRRAAEVPKVCVIAHDIKDAGHQRRRNDTFDFERGNKGSVASGHGLLRGSKQLPAASSSNRSYLGGLAAGKETCAVYDDRHEAHLVEKSEARRDLHKQRGSTKH